MIPSPLIHNSEFNKLYSYDENGMVDGDRQALRARTVIAMAFIRGVMEYYVEDNMVICGEYRVISQMKDRRLPVILDDQLNLAEPNKHIGYLILHGDSEAGWGRQPGWCALFLDRGVGNTMSNMYSMLKPTIRSIWHKPEIYHKITMVRYS